MTRGDSIIKLTCLVLDLPDCECKSADDYLKEKYGKTTKEMDDDQITDLLMELQCPK